MNAPKHLKGAKLEKLFHSKTVFDLAVQYQWILKQRHIDEGIVNDCQRCQNGLGITEASGGQAYVESMVTYIEYDDCVILGWNSKPMKRVIDIQDGNGKAKPGIYALNPRPRNQQLNRKRNSQAETIMPFKELIKLHEKGKLPKSDVALKRLTGYDDHLLEAAKTLIEETTPNPLPAPVPRIMSPLPRRQSAPTD